jgi:hypothetical protein
LRTSINSLLARTIFRGAEWDDAQEADATTFGGCEAMVSFRVDVDRISGFEQHLATGVCDFHSTLKDQDEFISRVSPRTRIAAVGGRERSDPGFEFPAPVWHEKFGSERRIRNVDAAPSVASYYLYPVCARRLDGIDEATDRRPKSRRDASQGA